VNMKSGTIGETTASHLENITDQIEQGVEKGKYTWAQIQETMSTKTKAAAEATDAYVHENPWKVVGMAAGLGLIIGLILARGGSDE
jgi:ElaB/YqjD/DUF883 family membrane-anchored ribosome-binding protein